MTQTRLISLLESFISAILAAPTATLLHWALLDLWGNQFDNPEVKAWFISISWMSFFAHSVIWKFIIRRFFENYVSFKKNTKK